MRTWRSGWKKRAAVLVLGAVASGLVACSSGASGTPQATPSSLVFPQTVVGQQATQNVVIQNSAASGTLTIESTGIAGDAGMFADGFDDATSVALAPGQSTTIAVVFSPTAAGSRSATLRVNHSGSGDLGVPLSGTAATADPGARPLVASPASLSFPDTTVGQPASLDVTLRNGAASRLAPGQLGRCHGHRLGHVRHRLRRLGDPPTRRVGHRAGHLRADGRRGPVGHAGRHPHRHQLAAARRPVGPRRPGPAGHRPLPGRLGRPQPGGVAPLGARLARPALPYGNAAATGSQASGTGATIDLSDPSVPEGTPMEVFQTERWDAPAAPDMAYAFPVPSGTQVEVRLYLAETYAPSQVVGGRIFDVKVDGTTPFRNVDVFARVGANRGLVLSSSVVSDGTVDLRFVPGVSNPSVKGVEVVTATGATPAWLAATPTAVDFPDATVRQSSTQDVTLTNVGTSGSLTVSSTAVSGPTSSSSPTASPAGRPSRSGPANPPPSGSPTCPRPPGRTPPPSR